jgi:glutamyl-tRNA synthetase
MSSTPKHLAIYHAFQWAPPAFAHVGLLTDQNHQKLSKRNMDVDISAYRDKMGVFPETLTNFVALLGWSHQRRSDVMDLQELISNVRHAVLSQSICTDSLAVQHEIHNR